MTSKGQAYLSLSCTQEDLDKEVEWFESRLTELLNSYIKITRITAHSKRWWNEEVAEARKTWAKNKKRLRRNEDLKEELKQACNLYYKTIRKAKWTCWQEFLQRKSQKSQPSSSIIDKNHCWTAFKYTKPIQFKTTSALKNTKRQVAVSMKAKETIVRKLAFPKPPTNLEEPHVKASGLAHVQVTQVVVFKALMTQVAAKAPGPNEINFRILQMI